MKWRNEGDAVRLAKGDVKTILLPSSALNKPEVNSNNCKLGMKFEKQSSVQHNNVIYMHAFL